MGASLHTRPYIHLYTNVTHKRKSFGNRATPCKTRAPDEKSGAKAKVCVDIGLIGHYDSGCFAVVAAMAVALSRVQRIASQTPQEMRSASSALCRTRDCFASFRSGFENPMAIQNQASSVRK